MFTEEEVKALSKAKFDEYKERGILSADCNQADFDCAFEVGITFALAAIETQVEKFEDEFTKWS